MPFCHKTVRNCVNKLQLFVYCNVIILYSNEGGEESFQVSKPRILSGSRILKILEIFIRILP